MANPPVSKPVVCDFPCGCGQVLVVTWQVDDQPARFQWNIVCPDCQRGYYLPSTVLSVEIKDKEKE